MSEQPVQNTDRELWREPPGDYYANSIHVTASGGIGIDVGGTVFVKPLSEWHAALRQLAESLAREQAAIRERDQWEQLALANGEFEGHGELCYYCNKACSSLAGNPSFWPIPLCHPGDPGRVKWHHIGCVTSRLQERETLLELLRKLGGRRNGGPLCWCGTHDDAHHMDYCNEARAALKPQAVKEG